jgi:hypothetical protein
MKTTTVTCRCLVIAGALALGDTLTAERPALAADTGVNVQVGLRAGVLFGGGWFVGATASAGWGGLLDRTSAYEGVFHIGGLAGVELIMNPGDGRILHVYAAPQVVAVLPCPVLLIPLAVGPVLAMGGGPGTDIGWQISTAVFTDLNNPNPTYTNPSSSPEVLGGLFYRYASPAANGAAQAIGLAFDLHTLPFDSRSRGLGNCGGD